MASWSKFWLKKINIVSHRFTATTKTKQFKSVVHESINILRKCENISNAWAVMLQSKMQNGTQYPRADLLIWLCPSPRRLAASLAATPCHLSPWTFLNWETSEGIMVTEKQSVVWSTNLPIRLSEKKPLTPVLLICLQTISPWRVPKVLAETWRTLDMSWGFSLARVCDIVG